MIVLLSPAKTLDVVSPPSVADFSIPEFLDQSQRLIEYLRAFSPAELASLMSISDPLAALNVARYQAWVMPFTPQNAKQALFTFNGDVYEGLAAATLSAAECAFAQQHLRILSGLYGVLRPLDLMQAYRLEMGTRLLTSRGKDLYAFWGNRITEALAAACRAQKASALINLASVEYFKAVQVTRLSTPVIQPVFEDWSNGRFKIVAFHAKRARGLMARFIVSQKIIEPQALQSFAEDGYAFTPEVSDTRRWVFRRRV